LGIILTGLPLVAVFAIPDGVDIVANQKLEHVIQNDILWHGVQNANEIVQ
jgi:hypothetical protein